MRSVVVDKIASVTQACGLSHEVRIVRRDPRRGRRGGRGRGAEQQVHLQHARAHQRPHGQGRQGRHRRRRARAPQGAVRLLRPRARARSRPGDIIQMLNIGGVLGICDSINPDKGKPFDCRVLGVVLHFPVPRRAHRRAGARRLRKRSTSTRRSTRTACRWSRSPAPAWRPARPPPPARSSSRMRHRGLIVDAFKATGVSLRRDILAMEDAGARHCADLHRPRHRHDHAGQRTGADAHHAHRACRRQARRHRVRARRRHPRHLRRRCDPRVPGHPRRAHRRGAVGQRSGRRLGRREAAARALRHRAVRGHRALRPTTRSASRSSASRWACRPSTP